ncbi:hypothetical protein WDU94_002364 [Cyamophila willieti]
MKYLGILLLLSVCILVRSAVDFKVLSKMAQLLEQDGKLTTESIQPYSPSEINTKVKEATLAFVEYCKKSLLKNGTLYIPKWDIHKEMKEAQSFVKGSLRDLQVKNLDSIKFHNLSTDLMNLTAKYAVYFDQDLALSGLYQVQGEFIGQKLFGDGVFDILISGMKCSGIVSGEAKDKHIHINSLESSFDMDDIKINITNFNVDQFSQDELAALMNSAAIIYVKQYQDFISKLGAPIVIQYLNAMIGGVKITSLYQSIEKALQEISA